MMDGMPMTLRSTREDDLARKRHLEIASNFEATTSYEIHKTIEQHVIILMSRAREEALSEAANLASQDGNLDLAIKIRQLLSK